MVILTGMRGFPDGSVVKDPSAHAGDERDTGSIPGSIRSPGGGNSNPFQFSCVGNSMARGTWLITFHRVTQSQTKLSNWYEIISHCGFELHLTYK